MTDFWQVVFTPSFMPRLLHVFFASWTVGAALMMSVSAFYVLKKRHLELARPNLKVGLAAFILFATANFGLAGPSMAIEVTNEQPLKLASMEGLWDEHVVRPAVPRGLGGRADPDDDRGLDPVPAQRARLPQPAGDGPGHQLRFAPDPTPPINLVFQVYHFMFGIGVAVRAHRPARRPAVLAEATAAHGPVDALDPRRHGVLRRGRDHRGLVDGRDRAPAVGRLQRARDGRRRLAQR